jgi:hypothetical protein
VPLALALPPLGERLPLAERLAVCESDCDALAVALRAPERVTLTVCECVADQEREGVAVTEDEPLGLREADALPPLGETEGVPLPPEGVCVRDAVPESEPVLDGIEGPAVAETELDSESEPLPDPERVAVTVVEREGVPDPLREGEVEVEREWVPDPLREGEVVVERVRETEVVRETVTVTVALQE